MQNEGRDDVELNFMNPINHVRYVSNNTNSAIKGESVYGLLSLVSI